MLESAIQKFRLRRHPGLSRLTAVHIRDELLARLFRRMRESGPIGLLLMLVFLSLMARPVLAASTATIAVHSSLTGSGAFSGSALVEAIRFAVDRANANGADPHINLVVYDDHSTKAGAEEVAAKIAASDALLVLGPALSQRAIEACPLYAKQGVPVIVSTAHADSITASATCHRTVISTGDIGNALANYLGHVLQQKKARLIYVNDGYGTPLAAQFQNIAARLGIAVDAMGFDTPAQRDAALHAAIDSSDQPPLVLGMTSPDAVPLLIGLRHAGYRGPIFGTATMARASFPGEFSTQPEEKQQTGFFTDGIYATSPIIPDSANAATLAYTAQFEARFHHEPSWESIQADDGTTLAIAAIRAALKANPANTGEARKAVLAYFKSLDSPSVALSGLAGPLWFTRNRIRPEAVRIGRFYEGLFESASTQIVPVINPDSSAIAAGAIFDLGNGQYGRLQSVVYTGIFVNQITRIDLAQSSFGADFYVWERFAHVPAPDAADPTNLLFPTLVSGSFDRKQPSDQGLMPDGTEYRLWRVNGIFRNDFDLHRFPFDTQYLSVPLFNGTAATDRIVYVLDRRMIKQYRDAGYDSASTHWLAVASPTAFRSLTQWTPVDAQERRDDLVTKSALGNIRRVGAERNRELSGFVVTVELSRKAIATVVKSLLPLALMTIIMLASLYFPHGLVKEKVTVAITAALSGAVLLTAINSQLGSVGYTLAVEYAFYIFFGLSVLCIVSVLIAERLRTANNTPAAIRVEHFARISFIVAVAATVIASFTLVKLMG